MTNDIHDTMKLSKKAMEHPFPNPTLLQCAQWGDASLDGSEKGG